MNLARHPLASLVALALALLACASAAQAQSNTAPAGGDSAKDISDRVKKDAASPLYWIRLNAQKADPGASKAPRITEVKSAPRPPRAAPAAALAGTPPPALPAAAPPPVAATATHPPASVPQPADEGLAAAPASLGAAGGLVAPSGAASTATDTARAAGAPVDDEPDDQPLALVKAEEPEFSATAMRKLRKGTVQVRFEVQADGSVANVAVVQTSHRSLNQAALDAVAAWRFQPVRNPRSAVVDLGFDLDG